MKAMAISITVFAAVLALWSATVSGCQGDILDDDQGSHDAGVKDSGSNQNNNGDECNYDASLNADAPDGGWGGNFGGPCNGDEDCTGYPAAEPFCEDMAAGVVPLPCGFCSAHCDEPHTWCATDVLCVGVEGIYTGCLAVCTSDSQCRTSEGYVCREMPYITSEYPDHRFCLPKVVPADAGT